jgi:nucleoside-diphosphate-sugar epimerase
MARVVVFGASGGVGSRVVARLLERGHDVTAVMRSHTDGTKHAALRVAIGSPLDDAFVSDCIEGRDAIVSCLGIRRRQPLNPWSALLGCASLTERATAAIVRGMQRSAVRRLVTLSAAGVGDSFSRTNVVMRTLIKNSSLAPAYEDLAAMERVLEDSSLDWAAVRPVTLTNMFFRHAREVRDYRLWSFISRDAVAEHVVQLMFAPVIGERRPLIAG